MHPVLVFCEPRRANTFLIIYSSAGKKDKRTYACSFLAEVTDLVTAARPRFVGAACGNSPRVTGRI